MADFKKCVQTTQQIKSTELQQMEQLESKEQAKLITKLTALGYMVVKIGLCNMAGFPDLMALRHGKAVFIEVKRKGSKARPLQEYRHKQLRAQGFEVYVCDDADNFKLDEVAKDRVTLELKKFENELLNYIENIEI